MASTWTYTEEGLYSRHTINGLAISVSGDGADDLEAIVFDERFFETTSDAYFQIGKVEVSGSDYVYELDAANGGSASFLLNLKEDGVTTDCTVPWSSRLDLNEFEPGNADVGLYKKGGVQR